LNLTPNIKAKELKKPFEETVLKVLGESSSHHQLWRELHPTDDSVDGVVDDVGDVDGVDDPKDKDEGLYIETNLKGKARAWEKATLDYKGDLT
jgi:hypothetical protein